MLTVSVVTAASPKVAVSQLPAFTVTQRSVSTMTLLQQGHRDSQAGRFADAITTWEQAAQQAREQEDYLSQALILSRLAAAYQELGRWEQAQAAIAQSLNLLNQAKLTTRNSKLIKAQALNSQGSLQLARGQAEAALTTWQQAQQQYEQAQDEMGQIGTQLNQAQSLQALGLYRRAHIMLQRIDEQLQTQPDSELKALGLESLGNVLWVTGDLRQSQIVLEQSLNLARKLDQPRPIGTTLLSLGNTLRTLGKFELARQAYQQSADQSPTLMGQLEAQLNQLSLLLQIENWNQAQALWQQIQPQLQQLNPSRKAIYAQVNGAASAIKLLAVTQSNPPSAVFNTEGPRPSDIAQLLQFAVSQAQQLEDARSESYAWGQLGHLYEQTGAWKLAEKSSQKALVLAQGVNGKDIAYQWHWQLGRIYNRQWEQAALAPSTVALRESPLREQSLIAYTEAVNTLQSVRADLLATNRDVQFSFKQSVEPLYRQLVSLLIQPDASPEDLEKARNVIEGLQLAELENYFRSACLDSEPRQIDQIDPKAAVIYPIVLSDRLEVILALPNQPLTHYTTPLPQSEVEGAKAA